MGALGKEMREAKGGVYAVPILHIAELVYYVPGDGWVKAIKIHPEPSCADGRLWLQRALDR